MSAYNETYAEFVALLAKSGEAILSTMTPEKMNVVHMAIGVAGEAGELLDAVKKESVYNRPADRENIVEELGDLKFYTQGIMTAYNITPEEVEAHNRTKLGKRYAGLKYSDEAAQTRADKA